MRVGEKKKIKIESNECDEPLLLAKRAWAECKYVDARLYLENATKSDKTGEAWVLLGKCYEKLLLSLERDMKKAADCFLRAAKLGNGWGMYEYTYCGKFQQEWYKKAFHSGDKYARAMCNFGGHLVNDYVNNWETSFMILREAAETNMFAQYQVAKWYDTSSSPGDGLRAFEWYLKSAERGLLHAQIRVAELLSKHSGTYRAWTWYVKAVKQGSDTALQKLITTQFSIFTKHEHARRAIFNLILIHKHQKKTQQLFGLIPLDVLKLTLTILWQTKTSPSWALIPETPLFM